MAIIHLRKVDYLIRYVNFVGFLFSLQASVARILFAGLFGIFSSSINKILLDAQIKEYNTQLSTNPNTYDESKNIKIRCLQHHIYQIYIITIHYHYFHEILET